MAKNDSLKQKLKQAAKRRANRHAARSSLENPPTNRGTPAENAGPPQVAAGGEPVKAARTPALDTFITTILQFDTEQSVINDRELLAAIRSVQRGYVNQEGKVAQLYETLVETRQAEQISSHASRRALDELIELVTAYGDETRSPRTAITYLYSITS